MEADTEQRPRDSELLEAARMGSSRAFERLVERYFGTVHAVAYARLGNRESAETSPRRFF